MISSLKRSKSKYQVHYYDSFTHWVDNFVDRNSKETPFSSSLFCLENIGLQKHLEILFVQQKKVSFGKDFVIKTNWIPKVFSLFSCFKEQEKTKQFIFLKEQFQIILVETILEMLADPEYKNKYPFLLQYLTQEISDLPLEITPSFKNVYIHKKCWNLAKNLTPYFYEYCLEDFFLGNPSHKNISNWDFLQKEIWGKINLSNFFFVRSILPEILRELQQDSWIPSNSCHLPSEIILVGPVTIQKKEIEFLVTLSEYIPITQILLTPNIINEELSSFGESLLQKTKICVQHLASFKIFPTYFYFTKTTYKITSVLKKHPQKNSLITNKDFLVTKSSSIWKEVETVREQVLKEFQNTPSLQLQDIFILTTDLEAYGEFLSHVFQKKSPVLIPTKITGSYGIKYSTICHAISDLFSLCTEKGFSGKIFDICKHKCIQKGLCIEEEDLFCLDFLQRTYPDLWGYSLEHQQQVLKTKNPQIPTFKKLLQNIINCIFEKNPINVKNELYEKFNHKIYSNSIGKIYQLIYNLEQDFSKMHMEKYTLFDWCKKTILLLQKYIKPINEEQSIELEKIIKKLSEISPQFYKNIWSLGCFYEFLQKILTTQQKRKFYGEPGGIHIGSIEDLAGIETKIIFLVGVSTDLFPPKQENILNSNETLLLLENYDIRDQLLRVLLGCEKLYVSFSTESSSQSPILEEMFWEITRLQNKLPHISNVKQSFITTVLFTTQDCVKQIKKNHSNIPIFQEIANKPPSNIPVVFLQDFLKNSIRSFFNNSLKIFLPKYSTWNTLWSTHPKWDLHPTKIYELLNKILLEQVYIPGDPGENWSNPIQTQEIKKIVIDFIDKNILCGGLSPLLKEIQVPLYTKKIKLILQNLHIASLQNNIDLEFWKNSRIFSLGAPTPQSDHKTKFFSSIHVNGIFLSGISVLALYKKSEIILVIPFENKSNIIPALIYTGVFKYSVESSTNISLLMFSTSPQETPCLKSPNSATNENWEYIPSIQKDKDNTHKKNGVFFFNEKKEIHLNFLETVVQSYLENCTNPKILYESMFWELFVQKEPTTNCPAENLQKVFLKKGKDRTLPHNKILNPNLYPCIYSQRFVSIWGFDMKENPYLGWPEKLLDIMNKVLIKLPKTGITPSQI